MSTGQQSSWTDTKSVLIDRISRVLSETTKVKILKNIERVHSKGASLNWEFSEKVKSASIQGNQNSRSQVFVS